MSTPAANTLTIEDLSKGLNTYDPASRVGKGFYVDAQNMVLENKTPKTVGGYTRLTASSAPGDQNVVWFEPYTSNEGVTTMIVATDAGRMYNYNVSTDVWDALRFGLDETALWSHVPFRGKLFLANGVDRPLRFDGTNLYPLGSVLVADFENDEDWNGGTVNRTIFQEGNRSRLIETGDTAVLTYDEDLDLVTGIDDAPDFDASDFFQMQVYRAPGNAAGNILITFTTNAAGTQTFTKSVTISDEGWNQLRILRSAFTDSGSANWATVKKFSVSTSSGEFFIFDDAMMIYAKSPPIGKYIELYAQQLVVAGIPSDLVAIKYSDAGTPEYFPASNIARFSGGRHALEKTDQITALRAYFDELIVGKVNSAWTFSGTGTNVSISALPLTIGIDSHRGVVETPWSLQFLFENNIFGARLTSRGLVSTNISSLLSTIDGNGLEHCTALRHDRSHTIRWSFREMDEESNTLGLIYDYQLDAWCSKYTPGVAYYTRGIVDGNRELLMCTGVDGHINRVDVGTKFNATNIQSYVTMPYIQAEVPDAQAHVCRWLNGTFYVRGTADVHVYARFADEPHEFETATFTDFGTITATPDGDKGFVYFGKTSRWMQVKLQAEAGAFEVLVPLVFGYSMTKRRV